MGQAIRPSQFILTYGVGSIIEAPSGPRLVPSFEKWDRSLAIFSGGGGALKRIEDRNASAQLNGGEIFEIPTNPQFGLSTAQPLFRTLRFPHWALCQDHRVLYRLGPQGRSNCPKCRGIRDAQDEAIRFVRACPNGHLDDVDWPRTVHEGKVCSGETFDWVEETGSDLKSVRIRCRTCQSEASLLDIYNRTSHCSGNMPEQEGSEPCNEVASVVLRSATSLRITEVVTSIKIPPVVLRIHTLLSQPDIGRGLLSLSAAGKNPKQDLLGNLRKIAAASPDRIDPATIAEVEKTPDGTVEQAIKDLLAPGPAFKTADEVKQEEFEALLNAAENGYPPQGGLESEFEVDTDTVIRFLHPSGMNFRVTPIRRLTVVLVQQGYRRPVRGPLDHNGRPVRLIETYYMRDGRRWYPGVALKGEGIFIDLPAANPPLDEKRAKLWLDRGLRVPEPQSYLYHPEFVWWHTFSHRLLKGLALDSGYSSAAIRERVYFKPATKDGKAKGGILLYVSQQGSDGSLGGLIAQCGRNEFRNVMRAAQRNLGACSNDPLCSEHLERDNGAACYACLLTAETSCEFHNMYLDRMLLVHGLLGGTV